MRVACLLTAYRRVQHFPRQLEAVRNQTVRPHEIAVWHNAHKKHRAPHVPEDVRRVTCQPNVGVWARFLFGLEFESEYVCVFDDDTIPAPGWLENCLDSIQQRPGLYGALGVIFTGGDRRKRRYVGWKNPPDQITPVDIVGHSWFFQRDWLRYFALEPRQAAPTCGEDYHFSVALQKHLGLGTYVPPHAADKSNWGSTRGQLGRDNAALWRQRGESQKKDEAHAAYLQAGWQPLEA